MSDNAHGGDLCITRAASSGWICEFSQAALHLSSRVGFADPSPDSSPLQAQPRGRGKSWVRRVLCLFYREPISSLIELKTAAPSSVPQACSAQQFLTIAEI